MRECLVPGHNPPRRTCGCHGDVAGVWLAAEAEFVAATAIAAAVWFFSNLWQPQSPPA